MKSLYCIFLCLLFSSCEVSNVEKVQSLFATAVKIHVDGCGTGSGTIVYSGLKANGMYRNILITAKHIVLPEDKDICSYSDIKLKVRAYHFNDAEFRYYEDYEGGVIHISEKMDIALAYFESLTSFNHVDILPSDRKVELLENIITVGFPKKIGPTLTEGKLQAINYIDDEQFTSSITDHLLRITSPIWFGNSGGGIFIRRDERYYLIGVTSCISSYDFGMGTIPIGHLAYAVSWTDINEMISEATSVYKK